MEGEKPKNPWKNHTGKGENQQQTKPIYDAGTEDLNPSSIPCGDWKNVNSLSAVEKSDGTGREDLARS